MTRRALVLSALTTGCLQPVGFPWDESAGAASSSGAASSGSSGAPAATTGLAGSTGATGSTSTGSTSTGSTGTTGDPGGSSGSGGGSSAGPICGDGHVDPGEECDDGDGDDSDGCTATCGRDRLIFVTSTTYSGDQIQGTAGGDTICAKAAIAGGLANPGGFRAWLSDRTHDATSRVAAGAGRYLRVDGLVVADDWADLLDGELDNPIVVTELDTIYESGVWTGTRPDGTRGIGADHCQDWTLADFLDPENGGFFGYAGSFDALWTFAPDAINPGPCGGELALYCVEQ